MRILAMDVGRRRTGLALSDPSATLARPLETIDAPEPLEAALVVIARLRGEDEGLSEVVVGLPRRLDGRLSEHAAFVLAFVDRLRARLDLPVHLQDERLTSHEADERLAARERNWRVRKRKLDAVAAAIILQEFLDARRAPTSPKAPDATVAYLDPAPSADEGPVSPDARERRRAEGRS